MNPAVDVVDPILGRTSDYARTTVPGSSNADRGHQNEAQNSAVQNLAAQTGAVALPPDRNILPCDYCVEGMMRGTKYRGVAFDRNEFSGHIVCHTIYNRKFSAFLLSQE
jgi:hypothetical protein